MKYIRVDLIVNDKCALEMILMKRYNIKDVIKNYNMK